MMKLPTITRRDTAAKIEAAEETLAAAQRKLADLEAERQAALTGDDVGALTRLSGGIAQQRAIIADTADRIAALAVVQRREEIDARKKARVETIDKLLPPRVEAIAKMAAEAETALLRFCDLFLQIEAAAKNILIDWPAETAGPAPYVCVGLDFLDRELFNFLLYNHRARDRQERAHGPDVVRRVQRNAVQIAHEIRQAGENFLDVCRSPKNERMARVMAGEIDPEHEEKAA